MEKYKVTDKRKSTKKSFDQYEKDMNDVKDIVKNTPKKAKAKTEKTVLCKNCKAEAILVKTIGCHEVYKCPNCKFTTERWL